MNFRYGLFATLATVVLAWDQGTDKSGGLQDYPMTALMAMGLVGNVLTRRAARRHYWLLVWLWTLAALWLLRTGEALAPVLFSLTSVGATALTLVQPQAITTSLLLGLLVMIGRAIQRQMMEALPLMLLLPGCVALLVWANPSGDSLTLLPLLAAVGLAPLGGEVPKAEESRCAPWRTAPAMLVELVSLQCVGWGLVLALSTFLTELYRDGLLAGVMMGFGTGFTAWLLSGILWGVAQNLRTGRLPVAAVARLVFGVRAVDRLSAAELTPVGGGQQVLAKSEVLNSAARPEIDVGESFDGNPR